MACNVPEFQKSREVKCYEMGIRYLSLLLFPHPLSLSFGLSGLTIILVIRNLQARCGEG